MITTEKIKALKAKLGSRLAILGHHYQSNAVLQHCDHTGDSLELARKVNGLEAEHIVFCGVFFMAESAATLCRADQKVHIPDLDASCPMADMAEAGKVEQVIEILKQSGRTIVPLTYVNSSSAVKAVVGRHGGTVCTSANAVTMMQWALDKGDTVLFLPDKHLARNTAKKLGIADVKVLDAGLMDGDPALFVRPDDAEHRITSWPGYCPIHDDFLIDQVTAIRTNEPDALVVVHPESPPVVVDAVDADGSTSFIIKYVADAPDGVTIHVGTECNLVDRLTKQYAGNKVIKRLAESFCEDMGKITEDNLAELLETIDDRIPVEVPDAVKKPSKIALDRMLDACK